MSSASVMTRPLNPSCCLSSPVTMAGEVVATRLGSGSSAGTVTCATMMASTPAFMAASNGGSIPVAGEVFGRGQHAVGPRSLDVGGDHFAHLLRIFAERAGVNDGIGGIGVDVGIREEVPLHPHGARLLRRDSAELFRVIGIAGSAEGHGVGKHGAALKPHGDATLEVSGENQRQPGLALQLVHQHGCL